ncbi:hypothetical protein SLEP1_g58526 [Rubroshorea leprosula]|uniref:Uncharacterized protein n=1 Tax=Rubroshorea leprosula TaxID=152421 RepID=A0AAV5MSC9_9ROSI|nr:hypothetical protein SLEP1_g58526 [Rubroshorea leprosula]
MSSASSTIARSPLSQGFRSGWLVTFCFSASCNRALTMLSAKVNFLSFSLFRQLHNPTLLKFSAAFTPENPEVVSSGKHSDAQVSNTQYSRERCSQGPIGPRGAGHVGMLVQMLLQLGLMGGTLNPLCIVLFGRWAYPNTQLKSHLQVPQIGSIGNQLGYCGIHNRSKDKISHLRLSSLQPRNA